MEEIVNSSRQGQKDEDSLELDSYELEKQGDKLRKAGQKEEAIEFYKKVIEIITGDVSWSPKTDEGKIKIFPADDPINPSYELIELLDKMGRDDEADLVRREIAEVFLKKSREKIDDYKIRIQRLNSLNLNSFEDEKVADGEERVVELFLKNAAKLFQKLKDKEGIQMAKSLGDEMLDLKVQRPDFPKQPNTKF